MQSRNEVADMVLMKILSKLASKSVIRFMNVCKSWRSSLGTPYFWTQHQHNGLKSNKLRLLIKCYHQNAHSKTTYFSGLSTEKSENFSVKRNIHIPYFENLKDQYSIHGQCNGLLCLHNHDDIAIWNPSTREITILPPPPMQLDPVYDVNLLNVGFDYKTNDYKVLRMFQKISPQKLLSTMLTCILLKRILGWRFRYLLVFLRIVISMMTA
ncbi:hypothetical protein Gorai_003732 [Gossypium raimondii]|uniref:F-box domain-containing protein n=1 Tax=Gossypium raimondii TaxID=29730 RepID=A0A7J8QQI9_GOSRA|nr:hypothetical protein [Gossypium raimondii]